MCVIIYLKIDSNINHFCEKVVDYYDTRTRLILSSNFLSLSKINANRNVSFLLFKKVIEYDNFDLHDITDNP